MTMKLLVFGVTALLTFSSPAPAANIIGQARIVDGDSLVISGTKIRLHGIDAPESRQHCQRGSTSWACGRAATNALVRLINGQTVVCEERDRDRYGRIVAVCHLGSRNLNQWMVSNGWALAYRRYSTAYVNHEAAAKKANRGIWTSQFTAPWDWRRGKRL